MVIVGELKNEEEMKSVQDIVENLQWPVLVDILSRLKIKNNDYIFNSDLILKCNLVTLKKLFPKMIIQIGTNLTSASLISFLVNYTYY